MSLAALDRGRCIASPRCRQMETLLHLARCRDLRDTQDTARISELRPSANPRRTERTTMSWADPVIATALAALAERTATAARLSSLRRRAGIPRKSG